MSERVVGPILGHYIASYACPVGELGNEYVGYGRLCEYRPRSFWSCVVLAEVIVEGHHANEDEAHEAAQRTVFGELSRRLAGGAAQCGGGDSAPWKRGGV